MALSIGGLSAYSSAASVQPMNYAVSNQSEVSSAYQESLNQVAGTTAFLGIHGASPVQYANAQYARVDSTAQVQRAQEVNRELNTVAAGFEGQSVGYQQDSTSYGYQMLGSILDLYA